MFSFPFLTSYFLKRDYSFANGCSGKLSTVFNYFKAIYLLFLNKRYNKNNSLVLYIYVELTVHIYQLPLILNALEHFDLINVAYLTACAFIRSL